MNTQPKNAKELVRLSTPTDMSAEGLTKPIPGVCRPMIKGIVPIRKNETGAMRKVIVVDLEANHQNGRSILPVILQAPDHIHIHHRKEGNQFHQILLVLIDLIRKSQVRLTVVTSLCHLETEVIQVLVKNLMYTECPVLIG